MGKRTLECGQGQNRDQLPRDLAPGVWNACANMRFRNGRDERVGGVASVYTPSITPYAMGVYDVGTTSGITKYVVAVGLTKVYVWNGSAETEITRGLYGNISSMSGGGATVTVTTSANHGLSTGDNVIISGVVPTGYNTAIAGVSITVTGANTFTYANATTAAVTTQGRWESNRTSNFGGTAGDEFSVFSLNGILYVNLPFDGLYYWSGSTSTGAQGRLRRVMASSSTYVYGRTARAFGDYVFVIGYNPASNTDAASLVDKPYTLAWGSAAEPGSVPSTFTAAASNDAGSIQKTRGAMVDALEMHGMMFVYHERAILEASYIGGNDVFNTRRYVNESDGLLAPNCIVNTPKGQVFFTQNYDLKIHNGGSAESVADGRMWQWIKSNIDTTYAGRSFLTVNRRFNEVNLFIPTSGNSWPNKCLIWNYQDNTWGERTVANITCGVSGMLPTTVATDDRLLIANTTPAVGLVDSGTTYFGASYTSSVERVGMDLGDADLWKTLHQSRINADAANATTLSVYHGSSPTADGTVTYTSAITYTHNTTKKINGFANSGPFLAYKIETSASDTPTWRSIDLMFNEDGSD